MLWREFEDPFGTATMSTRHLKAPSRIIPRISLSGRGSRSAAISCRVSLAPTEGDDAVSLLELSPRSGDGETSRRISLAVSKRTSFAPEVDESTIVEDTEVSVAVFSPSSSRRPRGCSLPGIPSSAMSSIKAAGMDAHWDYPLGKQGTLCWKWRLAEQEVAHLKIELEKEQRRHAELEPHLAALQSENEWLMAERAQHIEHAVRSSFDESLQDSLHQESPDEAVELREMRRQVEYLEAAKFEVEKRVQEVEENEDLQRTQAVAARDQASALLKANQASRDQVAAMSEDMMTLQAALAKKEAECAAAASAAAAAESESTLLREQGQKFAREEGEKLAAMRNDMSTLQVAYATKEAECLTAVSAAKAAENEATALREDGEKLVALHAELHTLQTAYATKEAECSTTSSALAAAQDEANGLRDAHQKLAALHVEMSTLQTAYAKKEDECVAAASAKAAAEKEANVLRDEGQKLQVEVASLGAWKNVAHQGQEECNSLRSEIEVLQKRNTEHLSTVSKLQAESECWQAKLKAELEAASAELDGDLLKARDKISELQADLETVKVASAESQEELKAQCTAAKEETSSQKARGDELEKLHATKAEKAHEEISQLRAGIDHCVVQQQELESKFERELAAFQEEAVASKARAEKLETCRDEQKDELHKLETNVASLEQRERELVDQLSASQDQAASERARVVGLEKELELARSAAAAERKAEVESHHAAAEGVAEAEKAKSD